MVYYFVQNNNVVSRTENLLPCTISAFTFPKPFYLVFRFNVTKHPRCFETSAYISFVFFAEYKKHSRLFSGEIIERVP